MYAILVSVENEGDFITTFRKNSKKEISCKFLTDFVYKRQFVNMVKRLDYDVDVKIGRCVFDAKSLMSVLMIAGNPDAVVEAHTNDIEAFKKKFKDYFQ